MEVRSTVTRTHPASLLPSLRDIAFVCPLCRERLDVREETYHCSFCQKTYPLHGGIPDFRVFPDPYLDFPEDHKRTEIVIAALESHRFEALLEYYWTFSDVTPEALRSKFIRSAIMGDQRAKRALSTLQQVGPTNHQRVLEIGSGTGNFLAAAAPHYEQVIGIDIAMRWLHVSRRRFMDALLPVPPLVCCCAEYLPFPDGVFDLAVTSSTLEFTRDPGKVLSECARTLKHTGSLFVNTVNRYSIAPSPYVYLWGVGLLPRAWQPRYVRWRRGASYENVRPLSYNRLRKTAAEHFSRLEFLLPDIADLSLRKLPWSVRLQVLAYRLLKKMPPFRMLLKWIGPGWDARFFKNGQGSFGN